MARRCSQCNLLCGVEQAEPEGADELEVHDGGPGTGEAQVTGDIRLVLTSACCGDEIAEAQAEVDETVVVEHKVGCPFAAREVADDEDSPEEATYSIEVSGEATDWSEGTSKSARYNKTFYGADISGTVTCDECDGHGSIEVRVGEQASYFDELN